MSIVTVKDAFRKLKEEIVKFATAVGQDLKSTNNKIGALNNLSTENKTSLVQALNEVLSIAQKPSVTQQDINNAISNLKNELMGGELDAHLDTLKELGDKLKELQQDDNLSSAIIQKFTEVNQKIEELTNTVEPLKNLSTELEGTDFVGTYNTAKGA
ncbi:hypothetical protein NMW79_04980 [Pasteurella multocida]|uniref:hypothetical protein n=1 Tax=Pasteurella canis TaxID=753 RepID=UPI001CC1118D|nr:hypothetical protein [Pasteurella canis]MDY0685630.1 hypothetical protein [Pasteurella multocida]UAX42499.1 hypothetical protein K7G89_000317 [Pasteurella canis]HDR0955225.1 hypothetical protein [Pasteurella multocida]HDX1106380.1 hypothetical protein [Pasteurella multocida]